MTDDEFKKKLNEATERIRMHREWRDAMNMYFSNGDDAFFGWYEFEDDYNSDFLDFRINLPEFTPLTEEDLDKHHLFLITQDAASYIDRRFESKTILPPGLNPMKERFIRTFGPIEETS